MLTVLGIMFINVVIAFLIVIIPSDEVYFVDEDYCEMEDDEDEEEEFEYIITNDYVVREC